MRRKVQGSGLARNVDCVDATIQHSRNTFEIPEKDLLQESIKAILT